MGREKELTARRDTAESSLSHDNEIPPSVHEVLNTPGEPLTTQVRVVFESRFGHDFTRVRVHADPAAAESARQIAARAYTVGEHMVFGAGQYQPATPAGRKIIAHELTHVLQQRTAGSGSVQPGRISNPHNLEERQAEAAAEDILTERPLVVANSARRPDRIQRTPDDSRDAGEMAQVGGPGLPALPTPATPTVKAPSAGQTADCSASESSLIASAVRTAQSRIAAVLPQLAASPLTTDMQNALWIYFRDSTAATAKKVSDNLTKISSKLGSLTYECESKCDPEELGYTRLGTMVTGLGHIHLCMKNLELDAVSIADTIIHEAAHYTLLATDSAGYYSSDCSETETTVSAGSTTKLDTADSYSCFVKNWLTATPAERANARGDITGANIAGIEQSPPGPIDLNAPRRKTLFTMKLTRGPLAIIPGVSYRWVFRDPHGRSYLMTDFDGNDLFQFKPAVESVNAALNTPTRDLLKLRGITSGVVLCRASSRVFGEMVFALPVTFGGPAPPSPAPAAPAPTAPSPAPAPPTPTH
jgi:hypothetical protein